MAAWFKSGLLLVSALSLTACGGASSDLSAEQRGAFFDPQSPSLSVPDLATSALRLNQGQTVNQILVNNGGSAERCSSSPALPDGLFISAANGSCLISGNALQPLAQTSYQLTAANGAGIGKSQLNIEIIASAIPLPAPQIADATINGKTGQPLQLLMLSTAGPINQCLVQPELPAGLNIMVNNNQACEINGSTQQLVAAQLYSVAAVNASGRDNAQLSLTISPSLSAPALADSVIQTEVGKNFAVTLINSGGSVDNCQINPALPAGLILDKNADSCQISGVVTQVLTDSRYIVTAQNPAGSDTAIFTLSSITQLMAPNLTDSRFDGEYDLPIEVLVPNTGGRAECTIQPGLPDGLLLSDASNGCLIKGSVGKAHLGNYQVSAENISGSSKATLSLVISEPLLPPQLSDVTSAEFKTNQPINIRVNNSGGALSSCRVTPDLMAGLVLNFADDYCRIEGQVSEALNQRYQLTAENRKGSSSVSVQITVAEPLPLPVIEDQANVEVLTSESVEIIFSNSGGNLSECRADSDFPDTLSLLLNQNRCVLSGYVSTAAELDIRISAVNESGEDQAKVKLIVREPLKAPQIAKLADYHTIINTELALSFANTGGDIETCRVFPDLIDGLTLSQTADACVIRGNLSSPINQRYQMKAINAAGESSAHVLLLVREPVSQPLLSLAQQYNVIQDDQLTIRAANNGGDVDTCTVTPDLPSGFILEKDNGTCVISGSSSDTSEKTYRLQAGNESGNHQIEFSLAINQRIERSAVYQKLSVTADSYINGGNKADENYGSAQSLTVQTADDSFTRLSLFKFVSETFNQQQVDQAWLKFYVDDIHANPGTVGFEISASGDNWLENELTFNREAELNFASDIDNFELQRAQHAGSWVWLDITDVINNELNQSQLTLKLTNNDVLKPSRLFIASKEADGNRAAELVINPQLTAPQLSVNQQQLSLVAGHSVKQRWISEAGVITACNTEPALPQGLQLVKQEFYCELNGTPVAATDLTDFQVSAENTLGTEVLTLSLQVEAPLAAPSIANQSVTVLENEAIQLVFSNPGSNNQIDRCIANDVLPGGLQLNKVANSCVITGSLANDQEAISYRISAENAAGSSSAIFTLTVNDPAPQLTGTQVNQAYDQAIALQLNNSGGAVDQCNIEPQLPSGLALTKQSSSCYISGSLTQVHNQNYSVTGENESGSSRVQVEIIVTEPLAELALPEIELPGSSFFGSLYTYKFEPGDAISLRFINNGGAISECDVTPQLPLGVDVQLVNDGCEISGRSDVEVDEVKYQVTASNSTGTHSADVKFKIEIPVYAPRIDDDKTFTLIQRQDIELVFENIRENSSIDSCTTRGDLPLGLTLVAENNSCVIRGAAKEPLDSAWYQFYVDGPGGRYHAVIRIEVAAEQIDLLAEIENAELGNANDQVHAFAPQNVVAEYNPASGLVGLSWQAPQGVTIDNFRIDYGCAAEGSQLPAEVMDVGLNTSATISRNVGEKCIYIVSTISADKDKYSWKAFLNIGPGRFSGPRSLLGVAQEQAIELNWLVPDQIPDSLNQFTVSGYKIYRQDEGQGGFNEIGSSIRNLSYTDDTVVAGVDYSYRIVAVINNSDDASVEESRRSNQLNNLSLEVLSNLPQATQLRAAYIDGQVVVDWLAPVAGQDISSDIRIDGYRIYRKEAGEQDDSVLLENSASTQTFFVDNTAQPGTEYFYKVEVLASNHNDGSAVDSVISDEVRLVAFMPVTDLPLANIISDSNRDGYLTAEDNFGEDSWSADSGAVFGPNLDDDDGDGEQDGSDSQPNGEQDFADMAQLIFKQMPQLADSDEVILDISYDVTILANGNGLFRHNSRRDQEPWVFMYDQDDANWTVLNDRDEYPVSGNTISADVSVSDLKNGDVTAYVDSLYGRHPGFDGNIELTLKVLREGVVVSQDSVALRGAPVIYSNPMQQARRIFITDKDWTPVIPLYDAIESGLEPTMSMAGQQQPSYWAQDAGQFGYSQRPGKNGLNSTYIGTRLPSGTTDWFGYTDAENGLINFAQLGSDKINAGGNVEIIPPYSHNGVDYPLGRIIVGGSIDTSLPISTTSDYLKQRDLYRPIMDFFSSQEIQGPPIVVPTGWLTIGHIDEVLKFLPNLNAQPDERSWVVAIAAPEQALDIQDKERELNLNIQRYVIDEIKQLLKQEVGLTDEDFIEIPMLYAANGGSRYSSVINMQAVGDNLYVPKPFAKKIDGIDPFEQVTRKLLEDLGYNVEFISILDTYFSPGNGGGIHCGTNVEFYPNTETPWWKSGR